jgi:hypothetical protein
MGAEYFYFKLELDQIFFIRLLMKFTGDICPRYCDFRDEMLKTWHQHKKYELFFKVRFVCCFLPI